MEDKNKVNKLPTLYIQNKMLDLVSEEEKVQKIETQSSTKYFTDSINALKKNKVACIGGIVFLILLIAIIIVPYFWPYSYKDMLATNDASASYLKPFEYSTSELTKINNGTFVFPHVFGTDGQGRDYFIRVIMGARVSISVGVISSLIVLIIGLFFGTVAGYFGGKVDMIIMRIIDVIYSLPDVLIIILLSVILNNSLKIEGTIFESIGTNIMCMFIVFALIYWVGMARMIRGQVLSIKKREYVLAAQSFGSSSIYIIMKHLIPNCLSIIIISTTLQIPSAIFTESFLSFLGLGVSAPMPSLGSLAANALGSVYSHMLLLLFPSIIICIIVLTLNLFGDGLKDAFDPKQRK